MTNAGLPSAPPRLLPAGGAANIFNNALTVISLAAFYVALEWISSIHEYKGLLFTAWDPGLGVLFGVMVLHPVVGSLALFLGTIVAETLFLEKWLDIPRLVIIAAVIPATHASILKFCRSKAYLDTAFGRLRDIWVLQAAGAAGAVLSAIILAVFLVLTGNLEWRELLPATLPQMVGDSIGIAVMAPLTLKFWPSIREFRLEKPPAFWIDATAFLIAITLFCVLAVGAHTRENLQYFYVLFVPVVLAAVRHGHTGAMIAIAVTLAALVVVLDWLDADASRFTNYQTLMLVLTATGLLVGAHRQRARPRPPPGAGDGMDGRARRALQPRQRHGRRAQPRNLAAADSRARPRAHHRTADRDE